VIAQNFGAFGVNPSKYWLHCRHLVVDGRKMSKSAGNYYTLRDLLERGFEPMAIKYLLLSMSYRRRLNFTFQGITEAERKLEKIHKIIERLEKANGEDDAEKIARRARKKFERVMDDNLNTGKALKILEDFTDEVGGLNPNKKSSEKIIETFKTFDSMLGLGLLTSS
jgi:cysteinyl-tRNA synthetase